MWGVHLMLCGVICRVLPARKALLALREHKGRKEYRVPGIAGAAGVACWDLNANGLCDLATEDINTDGLCDALDCKGAQGAQGAQGLQGDPGPAGAAGPQGPQGPAGADGAMGPVGPQGPIGLTGADGPQGPQGPQGIQGDPGIAGADGVACWDLDASGACEAAEDINGDGACNSLDCKGADGAVGPAGPQGLPGATITSIVTTSDSSYTIQSTDYTVFCNVSSSTPTVTLPSAASNPGRIFVIRRVGSGNNNCFVTPVQGGTVELDNNAFVPRAIQVQSDGTTWWIIAQAYQ